MIVLCHNGWSHYLRRLFSTITALLEVSLHTCLLFFVLLGSASPLTQLSIIYGLLSTVHTHLLQARCREELRVWKRPSRRLINSLYWWDRRAHNSLQIKYLCVHYLHIDPSIQIIIERLLSAGFPRTLMLGTVPFIFRRIVFLLPAHRRPESARSRPFPSKRPEIHHNTGAVTRYCPSRQGI